MLLSLFLIGQLLLFTSFFWTTRKLYTNGLLMTPWGIVALTSYLYLFVYYGPTSVGIVLDQSETARIYPWFRNSVTLPLAICIGMIQQVGPAILTAILMPLRDRFGPRCRPWSKLDSIFGNSSTFWYGILGSANQLIVTILFSKAWTDQQFVFADLVAWQKLLVSSFLIFTFGPQCALALYNICATDKRALGLSAKGLKLVTLACFAVALIAFSAFSFRTYALTTGLIAVIWSAYAFHLRKSLLVALLPLALIAIYTQASLTRLGNFNVLESPASPLRLLVSDLGYRSGFGTDSAIIGATNCVSAKLQASNHRKIEIFSIELASGLPRSMRDALYPRLGQMKLEALAGLCYKEWLRTPHWHVDLLDVKSEYFLFAFPPLLGGVLGVLSWSAVGCLLLIFFVWLYKNVSTSLAFAIPASLQALTYTSTPADYLVLFKSLIPLMIMVLAAQVVVTRIRRLN